jgi:hypothetical protein
MLLAMDKRTLRKIIYSHAEKLNLLDLVNRVPCPLQLDPEKFQRLYCWAITDESLKEAIIKVFEYTTFMNSNIITAEMIMPGSSG